MLGLSASSKEVKQETKKEMNEGKFSASTIDTRTYRFVRESNPRAELWDELSSDIDKGWAKSVRTESQSGATVYSVSYKEMHQEKYAVLPIGARSLLIGSNHELLFRGVNKFSDFSLTVVQSDTPSTSVLLEEAASSASSSSATLRVFLQEKLAGFIVHLFSLDGVHLEVMTKHVLNGVHVDLARKILFDNDQGPACVRDPHWIALLYKERLVVSGELIDLANDRNHPVLERVVFNKSLVVFSIGRRDTREEQTWPWDRVQEACQSWGLRTVPTVEVANVEQIYQRAAANQRWNAEVPEGHVLLVEHPTIAQTEFVVPVRFKIKTLRYRTVRLLRSLLQGELYQPQLALFCKAFVSWMALRHGHDAAALRAAMVEMGIAPLVALFEDGCKQSVLRLRDAEWNIADSWRRLVLTMESEASATRCRFSHDVILFVGLPGTGKSTLCAELIRRVVSTATTPYRSVLHVSRDVIAQAVAAGHEQDVSRHKARRQKLEIHDAYQRAVEQSVLWLSRQPTEARGLLLLDACHATREAREMVRHLLPSSATVWYCLLHCSQDPSHVLVERCMQRPEHPTLAPSDVQDALYKIQKIFCTPTVTEAKRRLVHFDTLVEPINAIAETILTTMLQGSTHNEANTVGGALVSSQDVESWNERVDAAIVQGLAGGIVPWVPPVKTKRTVPLIVAVTPLTGQQWEGVLWERVAETLHHALGLPRDGGILTSLSRWCSRNPTPPTPQAGHLRWVMGQILHGKKTATVSDVRIALQDRYSHHAAAGSHVTLQYVPPSSTTTNTGVAGTESTSIHPLLKTLLDTKATILVDAVLLDERGLCVHVSPLAMLHSVAYMTDDLHITLGHTHHVQSVYCKEMFSLFDDWVAQNAAAIASTVDTPSSTSKRIKQRNFVRLPISPPVALSGIITQL